MVKEEAKTIKDDIPIKKEGNFLSRLFKNSKYGKKFYESKQYKEFQDFKKEMHQFREDLKDHIETHPSPVIQTSLSLYVKN